MYILNTSKFKYYILNTYYGLLKIFQILRFLLYNSCIKLIYKRAELNNNENIMDQEELQNENQLNGLNQEEQDDDRAMDVSDAEDDEFNENASDDDSDIDLYSSEAENEDINGMLIVSSESELNVDKKPRMPIAHFDLVRNNIIYAFKPYCLLKCEYKYKHKSGEFPLARSGHRIIASNSHLYSLGGYNPRSALTAARENRCLLFQELWSYNFATNRWKLELNGDDSNEMPSELASNALAICNNVLVSHGGTGYPFGESCSNDCYIYNTGKNASVEKLKVSGDLPVAQYGPGIVLHENYLYTIGGTTGFDYSCDVYRLNLITKVWENVYICRPEMRDDPEGRYRHEVVYDGNHIFVLGGGTSNSVYDLQRIPAYNLKENCWDYFNTLPDRRTVDNINSYGFPKSRKCFSCVQHQLSNGDIEAFITGGLQGDFLTYFSDIWKLNLRTKQWMCIATAGLPKPLYFHSAAHSDNGCMYIFGGIEYNVKDMRRRNDLYKMWMTIPKLSEMCWDAIIFYNQTLGQFSSAKLLDFGIPKRFVERLPPK